MPLGINVFSRFDTAQMRVAIGAVLVLAIVIIGATQQLDTVTAESKHETIDRGRSLARRLVSLRGFSAVLLPFLARR